MSEHRDVLLPTDTSPLEVAAVCPVDGADLQRRALPQPGKRWACPRCGMWWA